MQYDQQRAKRHGVDIVRECDVCGNQYRSRIRMAQHMMTHSVVQVEDLPESLKEDFDE